MQTITISKNIIKNDDLVIIPRRDYEKMKANLVPAVYLKGLSAKHLDRRVARAFKSHFAGGTRLIKSLRELDK